MGWAHFYINQNVNLIYKIIFKRWTNFINNHLLQIILFVFNDLNSQKAKHERRKGQAPKVNDWNSCFLKICEKVDLLRDAVTKRPRK